MNLWRVTFDFGDGRRQSAVIEIESRHFTDADLAADIHRNDQLTHGNWPGTAELVTIEHLGER